MKRRHTSKYICKKRLNTETPNDNSEYYKCVNTIQHFIYKTYTKQYTYSKSHIKDIRIIYINTYYLFSYRKNSFSYNYMVLLHIFIFSYN